MSEQGPSGRESRQNSSNKQGRSDSSITVKTVPSATSFHSKKSGGNRDGGKYGERGTTSESEKLLKGSDKPPTLLKRQNKFSTSSQVQSSGQNSKVESRESTDFVYSKSKNDTLNGDRKSSRIDDRSSGNGVEVRTQSSGRRSSSSRTGGVGGSGKSRVISSSSRSARTFTPSEKYRGSSNHSRSSDVAGTVASRFLITCMLLMLCIQSSKLMLQFHSTVSFLESYRLRIPDVTLCQLLGNIAEDGRGTNTHIQELNNYLLTNTKSILRAGQNLWDSIFELLTRRLAHHYCGHITVAEMKATFGYFCIL